MAQKKKAKRPRDSDVPSSFTYEAPSPDERFYDLSLSQVQLSHPAINDGQAVEGVVSGYWTTLSDSRYSFTVERIDAHLVLPVLRVKVSKSKKPIEVRPGTMYLRKGQFNVPKPLQEIFPNPNTGTVDSRSRTYRVVLGMHLQFPFAYAESEYLETEPANVLVMSVGTVKRDGGLTASGVGRIVSGFLDGTMISTLKPAVPKPAPVPPCPVANPTTGRPCQKKPAGHPGGHVNIGGIGGVQNW